MGKFTIEKDIAQHIKRTVNPVPMAEEETSTATHGCIQFDERKGPTWHCIVGRNFGSYVTHGSYLSCRIVQPRPY